MDLTQRKLTKAEWEGIEVPVNEKEQEILELMKKGYHDVMIKYNKTHSLLSHSRIVATPAIHLFMYEKYFEKGIKKMCKKYELTFDVKKSKKFVLKKADQFRIDNVDSSILRDQENIYEFIILHLITNILKNQKSPTWTFYLYTMNRMRQFAVKDKNEYIEQFAELIWEHFQPKINIVDLIRQGKDLIESNKYLSKNRDIQLYDHQKKLYTLFRQPTPKLILYIAPTGTGKTMSPIGLSEKYKIIFVCAARHVGLALARSAISSDKKIALAFDCKDAEDIRLHYSAAKEYTRHRRSGAIRKVDNTVGDKVEIIICDIKSYYPAMLYMLAFNKKEELITYWDEPTITMDYDHHEFHDIIKSNWHKNLIPRIVLSSATLPQEHEIHSTISDYRNKFGGEVHSIISHDCDKSIPILTKESLVYLPHFSYETHNELMPAINHCQSYKTLMRYMDLGEIIKFIMFINEHSDYLKNERYTISNYFRNIDMVTMIGIKEYYLKIFKHIDPEKWSLIYQYFSKIENRSKPFDSNIYIATSDSHTLTDGPTIFLANDVSKIAKFYLQTAKIPQQVVTDIVEAIHWNDRLNAEITKLEQAFEDGTAKDAEKEKKMNNDNRLAPEMRQLKEKIEGLRGGIKSTSLNDLFVPNRREHIRKWVKDKQLGNVFTCDISDDIVVRLMRLSDIDYSWKLLLLMGIGVFTSHKSIGYTEIMKELATTQKLFMIIASTDYIYGTNYQFCHGYISKDLESMTQEKAIQAIGRVGRNNIQQEYSLRFRDNNLIKKLFTNQENKPEVRNMNRLFNSE